MHRKFIALICAASVMFVASAAPRPAVAVLPVFDPANFAKLVALLVKEDYITQQNAAKLVYDYQIATEAYNNGHLNYDMVYQQVLPMLQKVDKQMNDDSFIQTLSSQMMGQFQSKYGSFDPTYMFNDVIGMLNSRMQAEMGQIVSNARVNQQDVSNRSKQMDTLTQQLARSKGAVDSLATVGEELQVMQGTQAQIHTQLVNMLDEMHTYFAYQMAKDPAEAQQVGNRMLLQQFGKMPGQVAPPTQQQQPQAQPRVVGTPLP